MRSKSFSNSDELTWSCVNLARSVFNLYEISWALQFGSGELSNRKKHLSATRISRLFHVSEQPDIRVFHPRPSPTKNARIKEDVVFAISDRLLHNYLLPRDCPRVTFYRTEKTSPADARKFSCGSFSDYVVAIESVWYQRVQNARIYCYELPTLTLNCLTIVQVIILLMSVSFPRV